MATKPKFKFPVGSQVSYNGVPYEVFNIMALVGGNWYSLKNRIGYVQETELKELPKR